MVKTAQALQYQGKEQKRVHAALNESSIVVKTRNCPSFFKERAKANDDNEEEEEPRAS